MICFYCDNVVVYSSGLRSKVSWFIPRLYPVQTPLWCTFKAVFLFIIYILISSYIFFNNMIIIFITILTDCLELYFLILLSCLRFKLSSFQWEHLKDFHRTHYHPSNSKYVITVITYSFTSCSLSMGILAHVCYM